MIFAPDPELQKAAVAALRAEYGMDAHRPGMHQSELSHCLTLSYHDRTDPLPPTETEVTLWSIGFGLERVILAREETPAPIEMDGIMLSLDSINLFDGPIDLKSTRMRAAGRKGENGFQPTAGWVRQFKTYAKAVGVLEFGVVCIHLIEPVVTAWRLSFSHEELEANWQWYLERANTLENMLASQESMPFRWNDEQKVGSWDCQYCRYSLRCQLEASIEGIK